MKKSLLILFFVTSHTVQRHTWVTEKCRRGCINTHCCFVTIPHSTKDATCAVSATIITRVEAVTICSVAASSLGVCGGRHVMCKVVKSLAAVLGCNSMDIALAVASSIPCDKSIVSMISTIEGASECVVDVGVMVNVDEHRGTRLHPAAARRDNESVAVALCDVKRRSKQMNVRCMIILGCLFVFFMKW